MATPLTLDDFDFTLPSELIAQHPAPERSGSKLLDARGTAPVDRVFNELPALFNDGDLLIFNDTRVIKARLLGRKASGGAVEALVERILPQHEVLAHVRASKALRAGGRLRLADAFDAEVLGRDKSDAPYRLRFPDDPLQLLERHGQVPLPPYIHHAPSRADEQRYQTVFARHPGAVAAPTAALHFDAALLQALAARGVAIAHVTLHVGAGTFQPVRQQDLAAHRMHREWFEVGDPVVQAVAQARQRGARIVAVGTTSLRALESAARGGTLEPSRGETDLFIAPGYEFRVVDQLITNFHLPRSTLLMLVSAFAGFDAVRHLYAHAIAQRYRFFSYGDSMLLQRRSPA
jgi:S-adenosylmethionine:tRNA ribosyltransferase-isomerase